MFSLHACLPGSNNTRYVVPAIYAILCDKSQQSYTELLTAINNIPGYTFNPLSVMTDFEQGLQNSFQSVFPTIDTSGCLFHYNQALLRKVNEIGMKAAYEHRPINTATGLRGPSETKIHIRRAANLAFVPIPDIPTAWDEIAAQFPVTPEFDRFVTYFERTWVGNRRSNPLYALNKWNVRERCLNDLLTTNNNVEGFHNAFSDLVGHRNPTVWTWLDAVKASQNLSFNALIRQAGDLPAPPSNKLVLSRQRRLKGVLRNYGTTSLIEYLDMCNIAM